MKRIIHACCFRTEIPPCSKEGTSNEETRREKKQETQGNPKLKRLLSVQGKTKIKFKKDDSTQAVR